MIAAFDVCLLIDIEREGQPTVTFQSGALFVARQRLRKVSVTGLGSITSHLLLLSLTFTSNEDLVGASLVLFTSSGSMADGLVWVLTSLFGLAAGLLTRSTPSIFTIAITMTRLGTEMRATFELPAADLSAAHVFQPALLVLETLLATHTALFDKEGTSGTALVVHVTVVLDLRMSTCFGTIALEAAWRRLSATGQRRCQNGPTTVAVNFIENGLSTRAAGTLVAKIFAKVVAAFERSATDTGTNVLSLKAVIHGSNMGFLKLTTLALDGLTFSSLSLALATALVASMTTAIESGSADSHTLRRFGLALVADGG